jgi:3',5'-cyclic-nucleotide phosphodiesterase
MEAGVPPRPEDLRLVDIDRYERAQDLEAQYEEIRRSNEPTVLPKEAAGKLRGLLTRSWRDRRGITSPLLREEEFRLLSIPKGSLSLEERLQIQSHVSQTYRFLSSIPWTPELSRVPEIAYGHHEKLDGTGYPRGLTSDSIAVPARMLTVCDIFDALTASDRPYKKAVSREGALRILQDEARVGLLDTWMVEVFISERIWLRASAG